jgi:hypothetical protein
MPGPHRPTDQSQGIADHVMDFEVVPDKEPGVISHHRICPGVKICIASANSFGVGDNQCRFPCL